MAVWTAVAWGVVPMLAPFAAWRSYGCPYGGRPVPGALVATGALLFVTGFVAAAIGWRAPLLVSRRPRR